MSHAHYFLAFTWLLVLFGTPRGCQKNDKKKINVETNACVKNISVNKIIKTFCYNVFKEMFMFFFFLLILLFFYFLILNKYILLIMSSLCCIFSPKEIILIIMNWRCNVKEWLLLWWSSADLRYKAACFFSNSQSDSVSDFLFRLKSNNNRKNKMANVGFS